MRELRTLLSRTDHQFVGGGRRCGEIATGGLRKLDDGQNESIVDQRKRRAVEVLASSLQVRMPDGGKRLEDRLGFVPADAADVVVDRICAESRQRRGITA